jgi:hypothetical protein
MNPRVGASKWPEYSVWNQMRQRCENKNNEKFHIYGGRGIAVCDRWKNFLLFIEDMGRRPPGKFSIERIDNKRGYEPGNCKWIPLVEQARNRRNNRAITVLGESKLLVQWCEITGARHANILRSVRQGRKIEDVIRERLERRA